MKLLHTSDWHLGSSLYGHKRYEEFEAFLSWLARVIEDEQIDVLLVAGDIFDTSTPSNKALELYYRFLTIVTKIPGLQIVITAGNHDSPTLINAPQHLLKQLHIHVFGSISENVEDEILVINDKSGLPALIVCAIPYLRDRDIRLSEPGECIEDKTRKLEEGVQAHYRQVVGNARELRDRAGAQIPIIAMGHLFVSGGKKVEGDGVRELYVGNLARIRAETLSDGIEYFALGHLHVPQKIDGKDTIRYCGSPIALGFEDADQNKEVVIVEFGADLQTVHAITVPKFRDIRTLKGDLILIEHEIRSLILLDHPVWIQVFFSGLHSPSMVQAQLRDLTNGTDVKILRTRPLETQNSILVSDATSESLEDLSEAEVFQRCLDAGNVMAEDRQTLTEAFMEILQEVTEEDTRV